ncbi:MAG TPA: HAD-IA family hydrolase [Candidatus Peribacteraceae bacterium]|nr:HAD-IA family hydrolase [Candidatus Peribacteraceae bacterium]
MRYDAVFFDLDGTLVETGPLWDIATRRAVPEWTEDLSEEEYRSLGGALLHELLAEKGVDAGTIEKIRARRNEHMLPLMREHAMWREGAIDLLHELTKKRMGIVTSAPLVAVDALDDALRLRTYAEVIVTGEDMRPDYKPHPKGLLIACERLGVDAARCVYVGDQQCDLDAAAAAGMDAVLMRGIFTPDTVTHSQSVSTPGELRPLL